MIGESIEKSLTEQIYRMIRNDIIRQKIKCGQKINFQELKNRFEVSHTPLREALKRLLQEGLVEYYPNTGYRVIKIGKKDISEIIDLCSALDCAAIKLAMEKENRDQLVADVKKHLEGHINSFQENNEEELLFHIDEFHKVFYRYANNSRLSHMALQIEGQLNIIIAKFHFIQNSKENGIAEHKLIYQAVEELDVNKAISMMEYHWSNTKKLLLDNIQEE